MLTLEILHRDGFDLSKREGRFLTIRCSQCDAVTINGVPCHERGCYNARMAELERQEDEEREAWEEREELGLED